MYFFVEPRQHPKYMYICKVDLVYVNLNNLNTTLYQYVSTVLSQIVMFPFWHYSSFVFNKFKLFQGFADNFNLTKIQKKKIQQQNKTIKGHSL